MIIKDHRSRAYQLLTVGDAQVVTDICSESWQGESITPLSVKDRNIILENNNAWSLADLDVTAFSYAPIPYSYGEKFAVQHPGKEHQKSVNRPMVRAIDPVSIFILFLNRPISCHGHFRHISSTIELLEKYQQPYIKNLGLTIGP